MIDYTDKYYLNSYKEHFDKFTLFVRACIVLSCALIAVNFSSFRCNCDPEITILINILLIFGEISVYYFYYQNVLKLLDEDTYLVLISIPLEVIFVIAVIAFEIMKIIYFHQN